MSIEEKTMKPVTIAEAREKLSELIDAALRGEEVTITLDDQRSEQASSVEKSVISESVVKLIATSTAKRYPAKAGSAKGMVWMSDDFDAPLEEFKEYME